MVEFPKTIKEYVVLGLTVYSFFMVTLLVFLSLKQNIFGIVLSYQEQFFEWNITNLKSARFELLFSALQHFVLFLVCVAYQIYSKHKDDAAMAFKPLNQSEEDYESENPNRLNRII